MTYVKRTWGDSKPIAKVSLMVYPPRSKVRGGEYGGRYRVFNNHQEGQVLYFQASPIYLFD